MTRILIFAAALARCAVTATALGGRRRLPFPAPKVQQVFVAAQTVTTDGTMTQLLRARRHGRLPRLRGRREDAEDARRRRTSSTSTSRSRTSRTSS